MAIDASAVLGSAQPAGTKVNPRGYSRDLSSTQAAPWRPGSRSAAAG